MRNILIVFFCLCLCAFCKAQHDTANIYNARLLKKGFYKNYAEYLHNAPSQTPVFNTDLLFIVNDQDTIVTGARYTASSAGTVAGSWGFCDGSNVFISKRISLFKKRFFKAQYIGKHPFFLFWHTDIYKLGSKAKSIIPDSTGPTAPARYDLLFVDAEGKIRTASRKHLKQLFSVDPALSKKFRTERAFTNKVMTQYLVEFNERFIDNDR